MVLVRALITSRLGSTMIRIACVVLLFSLIVLDWSVVGRTQPTQDPLIREHDSKSLKSFHGSPSRIDRSFRSDREADAIFKQILAVSGLAGMEDRITVRASAKTENAAAFIEKKGKKEERLILYNAVFMQEIAKQTGEYWSMVAILAHEVGHHIRLHTVISGRNHEFELEADYQAGFILRRLGATLDQTQAAFRAIGTDVPTESHPARAERVQAATLGWKAGATAGPVSQPIWTPNQPGAAKAAAITVLKDKGISIDALGLGRALASVAVEDLELLLDAGITGHQLDEAFSSGAGPSFFERSRRNSAATGWFEKALKRGLNSNLVLPHAHYSKEGILATAMRAGNAQATLALVKAGASPHVYQDLWLSSYEVPRFLFPYQYILSNDKWSSEEKTTVAKGFADAGAVLVTLALEDGAGRYLNYHQGESIANVVREAASTWGLDRAATRSSCEGRLSPTAICQAATARTGRDWCKVISELPVRILWKPERYDSRLLRIDLQYLLNVVDDRGYVLVTDTLGPEAGYGLLELSADLRTWYLYKFTHPAAGMGHCKAGIDGSQQDKCWRRWKITHMPERSLVKVDDYSEYETLLDCTKKRPPNT